ncbi:phage minor capsid protein [Spirillospora sp. NPDC048911]|uniref:phage minor capsid protein n=1 Tax=Spirillospora sp. NPDC048911 TaxID=3364527 RepID=UPI00371231E8
MALDPDVVEQLAAEPIELYAQAELDLIADLARRLGADAELPDWAERKLAALGALRRQAEQTLERLSREGEEAARRALARAYERGGQAALSEIARLSSPRSPRGRRDLAVNAPDVPGAAAVLRLIAELVAKLGSLQAPILRTVEDVYREIVARATTPVLLGVANRRQAIEKALADFAGQGVTGFRDSQGRDWDLASYTEMAIRTATARAAVQGHLDRLTESGEDLVIVSDAPGECVRCRPWEGKVLSVSGDTRGEVEAAGPLGGTASIRVEATVAEATAAGLLHPNCRHALSLFIPGVTRPMESTEDPEGEAARRELRHLERKVREFKRRAAAAQTDTERRRAEQRVRDYQARIREHVDATGLLRQRQRERLPAG